MKNPLLPDPSRHPRLYAREYLRLRPAIEVLAGIATAAVALPVVAAVLFWAARLAFAL